MTSVEDGCGQPKTPYFANFNARLKSFSTCPPGIDLKVEDLAAAGFYYGGIRDQAICFHCDGGLKDWQPEDDPWIEHEKWYKHCGFINSKNAQLQLEKARKKLQVQTLSCSSSSSSTSTSIDEKSETHFQPTSFNPDRPYQKPMQMVL